MSDASSFLARNRNAIVVASLAAAAATGAYLYYRETQATSTGSTADSGADSGASSKKKKLKKSKKSKSSSEETSAAKAEKKTVSTEPKDAIYPVTLEGLPDINEETIANLSDKEKEEWALALKEDGNNEFKAKKYTEAIAFYTAALLLKKDPIFYSNRLACYSALNDHVNVIKDTTEAIKLKPDYTKCVLRRATSYECIENYADAMFDLTALTIYGGFSNKSIEQVLERVLKKQSMKIVDSKPKELRLPSAATIGSFFGAFLKETEPEGISEESTGADAFLYQALKNINSNTPQAYEDADTLINQAVEAYNVEELSKDSEEAAKASIALEYLAAFQFLKNDPASAASHLEKAIALKPRPRSYIFRALINADKSSYTESLSDFAKAEEMDPNCPDIFYHLGQLFYLTGDLSKAQANFEKAKELNPDNVFAYIQLACITYKNGSIEAANEKFTEAKLKFATSPEVPNYYGEILADKGDIQGACKQFDIAARLQESLPNFSVGALPLINKASIISRESFERIDEAGELLNKACELDPKSELARITLAQIKLQKDEVEDAIVLFEESSDLARSYEEKVQATSFAEATKVQKRIKQDPILTAKISELMAQNGVLQ